MKRHILVSLTLAFMVLLLVFWGTAPQILFHLLFGWISYLSRALPRVVIRWDGVGFFVVGIVLLGFLFHPIARWLRREMGSQKSHWRWQSSGMVLGIVILMFVTGITMVGITHQSYWLLSDDRDLMVSTLPGGEQESRYNLREMGNALLYSQDPSFSADRNHSKHSWTTYSLPFANYETNIDYQLPWDHPDNRLEVQKIVPSLLNPGISPIVVRDQDNYGVSHYAGNSRVFDENDRLKLDASDDGKSKTLLIGEVNANFQPWAKPGSSREPTLGINQTPDGFGGPASSGGAYFSLADGSVRFFSNDTAPEILRALSTPSDQKE